MRKIIILFSLLSIVVISGIQAQNVGIGTNAPKASAQLDVASTSKGMLMPRMTSIQRKAINNPEFGLLVFDTDKGTVMFFDGQKWKAMVFADENLNSGSIRSANSPVQFSNFGSRVAMSGNYAVIGAPKYANGGAMNQGAAYMYFKGANGWQQQQLILPSDSTAGSYFGGAVAIAGDYAVISAANKTVGANSYQGRVYVYKRNGSTWIRDTSFVKPNGSSGEYFGWSVAISNTSSGPVIAVGIPYSVLGGVSKGEVYSYRRTATNTWSFVQNIAPTDLVNYDNFGFTLSMDGDYLMVGAPLKDNTTYTYADAGAVYIYVYGGGVFTNQQKLSGTVAQGQFGATISVSDNRMAVGSPWATAYSNTSAAVYIYTRTGSNWANTTYMFLYDFEGGARNLTFGLGLKLDGPNLLIGASGGIEYPNGGSSYYSSTVGSVYFYKNYSGDGFTKTRILKAEQPTYSDLFAMDIGISGNNYIIGSPHAIVNSVLSAGNVVFGDFGN